MLLRLAMSPNELLSFLAMVTGFVVIVTAGIVAVRVMGRVIDRRLGGGGGGGGDAADSAGLLAELHELREEVAGLEHRLAENEERLDFTERLLAQQRVPEGLPPGPRAEPH